jgi:photosystem II stability/assembly factor-like uncharacterized protein
VPDLIERTLAEGRQRLLERIGDPGLAAVSHRATVLRRRRAASAATVAVALVLLGTVTIQSLARETANRPLPAATPTPSGSPIVYADAGLTINGVPAPPDNFPGEVIDVEYVDADRGYLLTSSCASRNQCVATFATTDDGGQNWIRRPYPGANRTAPEDFPPMLVALGLQITIVDNPNRVSDGDSVERYVSDDGGATWRTQHSTLHRGARAQTQAWPRGGRPQVVREASGILRPACAGNVVYGWLPVPKADGDNGPALVRPPTQPGIDACWAAAVPDANGGFWVGGIKDGKAAVAVTYDGGAHWKPFVFEQEAGAFGARVAHLGRDVYVVTYGSRFAMYHSSDFGATFGPARPHAGQVPKTLKGDPIALLDGRVLVIGDSDGRWYVAADPTGTPTWTVAGALHKTGWLERTAYGYVAHNLTGDYTAFSVDGSTWRKLNAI